MSVMAWTYIFVGLSFALYIGIAIRTRVSDTGGFYVAGRNVSAMANGMATAGNWMSAASFISMAGLISMMGYAGGVYLMGWTGGYVLLALLLAPYLRKFGSFTVPAFVGARYYSNVARTVAIICLIVASITYVIGDAAFVHDTLFMPDGGTARADFPGADARTLFRSIQRILELPDATRLYTGHDYKPGGREARWESCSAREARREVLWRDRP